VSQIGRKWKKAITRLGDRLFLTASQSMARAMRGAVSVKDQKENEQHNHRNTKEPTENIGHDELLRV
jgi:hypothetical protein